MTSEEKSQEILRQFNFNGQHDGRKVRGFVLDRMKQIAHWERDQTIDKACEWLKSNLITVVTDAYVFAASVHNINREEFIEEFKKAMEE